MAPAAKTTTAKAARPRKAKAAQASEPRRRGRPKSDNARSRVAARVLPDVAAYLESCDNMSQTIEAALMRSAGFKNWKRRNQ